MKPDYKTDVNQTNRVGNDAATFVLHFGENAARHQTGGGAAQDDIITDKTLDVLEDVLLDVQLLKDTLLKNTRRQRESKTLTDSTHTQNR